MKNITLNISITIFIVVFFLEILVTGCKQEPVLWNPQTDELQIGGFIELYSKNSPDFGKYTFSEFNKLIQQTGLASLLKIRGPYTLFLPTDSAMRVYYAENGIDPEIGITDPGLQRKIIYNHFFETSISANDIGLGAIRDTNALGDFIATEFHGADIFLNKKSKIIKQNIQLSNGYIHIIDKVVAPLKKTIYEELFDNPDFSIFTEGLKRSGLSDTLSLVGFKYNTTYARTRFTILAVPDTLYKRYGINNIEDLINKYVDPESRNAEDLKKKNNGFYRYMEYHCLNKTLYLSGFETTLYPILSLENNVSVTIDDDYKLNLDSKTQKYTGFYIPQSNIPTINGAIHVINDLLPVTIPERKPITFEATDFFDFRMGDHYKNYIMKWATDTFPNGTTQFAKIHWQGECLIYWYYYGATNFINSDCLEMLGFWSLSVTFPKIMKGKYKISFVSNLGASDFSVQMDGKMLPNIYYSSRGATQVIAIADFPTASEHTFTLRSITYGYIFWDGLLFEPID